MVGGLAAVAAVLGAAAGLDREQARELHLVGVEVAPVHGLGAEQKIVEGQVVDRLRLGARPVVAQDLVAGVGASVRDVDVHSGPSARKAAQCMGSTRCLHCEGAGPQGYFGRVAGWRRGEPEPALISGLFPLDRVRASVDKLVVRLMVRQAHHAALPRRPGPRGLFGGCSPDTGSGTAAPLYSACRGCGACRPAAEGELPPPISEHPSERHQHFARWRQTDPGRSLSPRLLASAPASPEHRRAPGPRARRDGRRIRACEGAGIRILCSMEDRRLRSLILSLSTDEGRASDAASWFAPRQARGEAHHEAGCNER